MLLVFSNYPKMWFYLLLRTMLPLSYNWIGTINILFLCSFQGTSARPFSILLCCFLFAFGRRTFYVRLSQAHRRASYYEKITSHICELVRKL